jgi:UDP-glucose 4-epimerase
MKYLVTGGAGFIGSHIVHTLLEQGNSVRVLDNFSTGKRENLEDLRRFNEDRFEILEGDLRDASRVEEAVRGVEVIFHQAAFVSVPQSMEEPQTCFDVNITGTSRLFDAARAAGVRRAVVASSAAVYGDSDALPLLEEVLPQPLSPYAVSKRVKEWSRCDTSTSTVPASDPTRCMPRQFQSLPAACWMASPSPSLAMVGRRAI